MFVILLKKHAFNPIRYNKIQQPYSWIILGTEEVTFITQNLMDSLHSLASVKKTYMFSTNMNDNETKNSKMTGPSFS